MKLARFVMVLGFVLVFVTPIHESVLLLTAGLVDLVVGVLCLRKGLVV